MYNPPMARLRVRHHTDDQGLDGIQAEWAIHVSRGWGTPLGVHVELAPFGTTRPFREGRPCPKNELGLQMDGAFVEFDAPADRQLIHYQFNRRKVAIIIGDEPLRLDGLNPVFVKVRRRFWEFWRTKPE